MQALLIKCAIRSTLIAAAARLVLLVMSIKALQRVTQFGPE